MAIVEWRTRRWNKKHQRVKNHKRVKKIFKIYINRRKITAGTRRKGAIWKVAAVIAAPVINMVKTAAMAIKMMVIAEGTVKTVLIMVKINIITVKMTVMFTIMAIRIVITTIIKAITTAK